jgi:hypothetical protein
MQNISRFQACRPIRNSLFIDEQRERDAGLFPKEICVIEIAQPDRRQLSSFIMETGLVFAQLRDVLAAKNSPIVPQEDQNRGSSLPKRAKPDLPSTRIRQDDLGQCSGKRKCHVVSLIISDPAAVQTVTPYYCSWTRSSLKAS